MGKCYCDYCDVFLTNDSVAVRKQHNEGNRHKYNVCEYYRQHIGNQLQEQIDLIVERFELRVARGLVRPTYALPTPKLIVPVATAAEPTQNDNGATANEEGDQATDKGKDKDFEMKSGGDEETTTTSSDPQQENTAHVLDDHAKSAPAPAPVAEAPQT